jgi:hypothetical protein
MKKTLVLAVFFSVFVVSSAFAVPVSWTDWTSADSSTASGTLSVDGSPVAIEYSGSLSFSQLGTGINYWTEGNPAPYTGNSIVDNAPTASEMLALNGTTANTITFSEALLNPLMAIVSLGRTNLPVTYDFDTSFSVLSEGRGYWGDGWYTLGADDTLTGYELHGVIQFEGLVSSISWTNNPNEYWHGFTFGVAAETAPVPEPSTWLLLGTGLAGLAYYRRKKSS